MKDENYILIPGWAINQLNLKGNNLMVYSIIYGFSQDGETEFTGSLQYLCDCLSVSKPTVINSLKELVSLGHIKKRAENINGVVFNRYKVSLPVVKNFNWGIKDSLLGGSKESLHNNTTQQNTTKTSSGTPRRSLFSAEKEDTKTKSKVEKFVLECHHISDEFEFDAKVSDKLVDFFRMLGQQGTFLPEVTIRAQLEEIYKFNAEQQKTIISETIRSGWKSLRYAAEKASKQDTPSFDTSKPGSFQPKDPKNDRRAEQYKDDEVF